MTDAFSPGRLADLAIAFRVAVEDRTETDKNFGNDLAAAITPDEEAEIRRICRSLENIPRSRDADEAARQFGGLSSQFIRLCEIYAAFATRARGDREIAAMIPEEKHSEAASAGFRAQNAETLARLFAP